MSEQPGEPVTVEATAGLLIEVNERLRRAFVAAAAGADLGPAEAKVLKHVCSGDPQPMRTVARTLGYDASNLTGVVDRLEDRGLLERRTDAQDRRVKTVVLTPAGTRAVEHFVTQLHAGIPLAALAPAELAELHRLLRLVLGSETTSEGRT
ncbi:MarR family winged helix-turn-helix transcriptional regulator [Pseudonocardia sp.]|uniref:MarR family winged helix-turn-helix transcriptional regulator n=1 Tax=Pseudonocardia sp. TaxID=60912 RepID=UPI003D10040A